MRIHFLLVKDLLKGGGIETYTREVGRRLAERGHEVTVYSTRGDDGGPSTWNGMNVIWLPKIRPYWTEKACGAVLAAYKELMTDSPDVIHLHSVAAGAMAAVLRYRSAPCIVQMHGIEWKRTRWSSVARAVLMTMERCSVAYGDAFTAVSKTQCEYYASRYGISCEYVPTAAELKEPASPRLILDLGLRPREYALFAARLVSEKGAHYLIPAFRRLPTAYSLAIAGEWPDSAAYRRRLLELAGDDPRVKFLGAVRGGLLEELFSNARVFVQPSELEGLSIGLIEAMSYGLQCVASDIPENHEVIGEAGLLFRNKDIDDLQRVLGGSMRDEAAAVEIGARARRRVEALFCWDRVVDQLESLYCRAISAKYGIPAPSSRSTTESPARESVATGTR
jgi:glycosyltransferase involved in cell wall biosynthesis